MDGVKHETRCAKGASQSVVADRKRSDLRAGEEWKKQIFTSPSIAYSSHNTYAKSFAMGDHRYKVVLQIKQNPGASCVLPAAVGVSAEVKWLLASLRVVQASRRTLKPSRRSLLSIRSFLLRRWSITPKCAIRTFRMGC